MKKELMRGTDLKWLNKIKARLPGILDMVGFVDVCEFTVQLQEDELALFIETENEPCLLFSQGFVAALDTEW